MKSPYFIQGKLARRYVLLFGLLGLLPAIAAVAVPVALHQRADTLYDLQTYIEILILMGVSFVFIVVMGGWITFKRLALPIQELAKGAEILTTGDLDYRIPELGGDDEISDLAHTFNDMADAIREKQNECVLQQTALEEMLARREAEFDVIAQVAALINRPSGAPNNLNLALEIAHQTLKTDLLALFFLNEAGDFVFTAYACDPEDEPLFRQHCINLIDLPLFRRAVETRDFVRIHNVAEPDLPITAEQQSSYEQMNIRRLAIKPVLAEQSVLGVLLLMRHKLGHIPQAKVSLLNTLTDHIATLIVNAHLRSRLRDLVIMEERRRLAHDLHDAVTQSLFSLSMAAEGLKSSLGNDAISTKLALEVITSQTAAIQTELRSLINELRPLDLTSEEGLEQAIKRHISSVRQVTKTDVNMHIHGNTRGLPKHIQQTINRISQEALSNVARHSQATRTDLKIEITDTMVNLSVIDNGVGLNPNQLSELDSRSFGLSSMRERAEWLGGNFEIRSGTGCGTEILVQLPLSSEKGRG
jgi:signal transduction histidine kinase